MDFMDQSATVAPALPRTHVAEQSTDLVGPLHCGEHRRGLLLIGLFKLGKATLAVLSGFAAYHLTHVDSGELAMRVVSLLHIDPVGRLAMEIMNEADTVSSHGLRQLGALSFLLALLYLVEGVGLMLEKVWAEYFTVIMTAGAMPFEIYELVEKYTDLKLAVLFGNAAIVIYLAVLLRQKRRKVVEFR